MRHLQHPLLVVTLRNSGFFDRLSITIAILKERQLKTQQVYNMILLFLKRTQI
jgi:hypothetical protein